jgi:hypothetical protein
MRPACPAEYQERITRAGGLNRYGEPNFKLAWSQSETQLAGGVWPHERYVGYRELFVATWSPYQPRQGYWMLMEWTSPEQYQGETFYHFINRDEATGLCVLGPYPHRGRYQIAVKLIWTTIDDGKMIIEPWSLNSTVIDRLMPVIMAGKRDSPQRRRQFAQTQRAQAQRKLDSAIDAVMNDAKRPLLLPSQIDDRIRLMEKQWAGYLKNKPAANRGFQQLN